MKHIILIGFMGCGKTSVGKKLAKKLNLSFVDMDAQIVEKEGMSITEIFAKDGEAYFRKLETNTLDTLLAKKEQTVISTGGGLPIQENNQKLLGNNCVVVYIQASVKVLAKRLAGDQSRPILQGGDLEDKITSLKVTRDPVYEKVSDIIVETKDGDVQEVVNKIVGELGEIG